MIIEDDHYSIPLLPREIAERIKDKAEWPGDIRARYEAARKQCTASKAEFATWIRRDRDSRMNRTAKQILLLILDCLNFETGRCDPGHQFIADELGLSVRTVERTIPRIAASGWLAITRRGRTTTNFYRLRVSTSKVAEILDYVDGLREQRAEERERRRQYGQRSDPTKLADHSASDPTSVRSHDPTKLADHDPTKMAGKSMNRTFEDEPLKEDSCSEGSEVTYPHTRESDDPEFPYDPPPSLEAGKAFIVKLGVPGPFIEAALQRHMRGMLYPCDVEMWKAESRGAAE